MSIGKTVNTVVFQTREKWRRYAIESLMTVERLAGELGLAGCLHLWPDKDLLSEAQFLKMQQDISREKHRGRALTRFELEGIKQQHQRRYEEYKEWIQAWHNRTSEWPRK